MENLKAKLKKQGGFTMVELLIVVAIIGILAAVSIPLFNNVLEKARHGVDQANARDAVSLAMAEYVALGEKSYGKYAYLVDKTTTHGGYLGTKDSTTETGITPECKCTGAATTRLTVTISAPAADAVVPTIKLSWNNKGDGTATAAP